MTDQPWVPDPEVASALRDSIKEAFAADKLVRVDPNADLLSKARGEMIEKFRASNPEIYDKLSQEFSAQFGGAVRKGISMGLSLATSVVQGVIDSANDDDDIDDAAMAYLNSIPSMLTKVAAKAEGELGDQDAG